MAPASPNDTRPTRLGRIDLAMQKILPRQKSARLYGRGLSGKFNDCGACGRQERHMRPVFKGSDCRESIIGVDYPKQVVVSERARAASALVFRHAALFFRVRTGRYSGAFGSMIPEGVFDVEVCDRREGR